MTLTPVPKDYNPRSTLRISTESLVCSLLNDEDIQPTIDPPSCSICHEVAASPVLSSCINQLVCFKCLSISDDIADIEVICPHCEKNGCVTTTLGFAEAYVDSFTAVCPHIEDGCVSTPTLLGVKQHMKAECPYTVHVCGCGTHFTREFIQNHFARDCPLRPLPCSYCDLHFHQRDMDEHVSAAHPRCDHCQEHYHLPPQGAAVSTRHMPAQCPVPGCPQDVPPCSVRRHLFGVHEDALVDMMLHGRQALVDQLTSKDQELRAVSLQYRRDLGARDTLLGEKQDEIEALKDLVSKHQPLPKTHEPCSTPPSNDQPPAERTHALRLSFMRGKVKCMLCQKKLLVEGLLSHICEGMTTQVHRYQEEAPATATAVAPAKQFAVVLFAFTASAADEMSLAEGDIVLVVEQHEGWCLCRSDNDTSTEGLAPASYLSMIPNEGEEAAAPALASPLALTSHVTEHHMLTHFHPDRHSARTCLVDCGRGVLQGVKGDSTSLLLHPGVEAGRVAWRVRVDKCSHWSNAIGVVPAGLSDQALSYTIGWQTTPGSIGLQCHGDIRVKSKKIGPPSTSPLSAFGYLSGSVIDIILDMDERTVGFRVNRGDICTVPLSCEGPHVLGVSMNRIGNQFTVLSCEQL